MALVDFRDGDVDVETLVDFHLAFVGGKDDAYGEDVIDFLKRHTLVLHLRPYGVGRLDAFLDDVFNAHLLKRRLDRCSKLVEQLTARRLGIF